MDKKTLLLNKKVLIICLPFLAACFLTGLRISQIYLLQLDSPQIISLISVFLFLATTAALVALTRLDNLSAVFVSFFGGIVYSLGFISGAGVGDRILFLASFLGFFSSFTIFLIHARKNSDIIISPNLSFILSSGLKSALLMLSLIASLYYVLSFTKGDGFRRVVIPKPIFDASSKVVFSLMQTSLEKELQSPIPIDTSGILKSFESQIKTQVEDMLAPYAKYIPLILGFAFFLTLQFFDSLLVLLVIPITNLVLALVQKLGIISYVTEKKDVKKIVITE